MGTGSIIALVTALLTTAGLVIKAFFLKSDAEKERKRVANEKGARSERSQKIVKAIQAAKKGDTSKVEELLNEYDS